MQSFGFQGSKKLKYNANNDDRDKKNLATPNLFFSQPSFQEKCDIDKRK